MVRLNISLCMSYGKKNEAHSHTIKEINCYLEMGSWLIFDSFFCEYLHETSLLDVIWFTIELKFEIHLFCDYHLCLILEQEDLVYYCCVLLCLISLWLPPYFLISDDYVLYFTFIFLYVFPKIAPENVLQHFDVFLYSQKLSDTQSSQPHVIGVCVFMFLCLFEYFYSFFHQCVVDNPFMW